MTRVRIPAPDIEEDVSAEQVAAYLARAGWVEDMDAIVPHEPGPHPFRHPSGALIYFADGWDGGLLGRAINEIATAEQRHPSAVLADIVGPAVGSVGADCGSFFVWKCPARMLAIVTMGYADVAKVCAREAQKESE